MELRCVTETLEFVIRERKTNQSLIFTIAATSFSFIECSTIPYISSGYFQQVQKKRIKRWILVEELSSRLAVEIA